ncbi:hypothetical protein DFP92_11499 [Yoonia sediminilitoris]|uniref:Uncharacterized protein n=2 Tax=Yoonia sediminilitoris TaxID=1286148 RepID=A0A2T6K989_9RHOB|nr:hypothetical protein C8N45_11498 [Yoonia sediminilitoris]RCW91140.1 hypothetical protein DFP92_11499 [Yoonia sediminilitoris]
MTSQRERTDDYDRVVTKINDRWRVIICRDGIQWILQKREGERDGRARWTGVSYSTGRKALIRVVFDHGCEPQPGAMDCLNALPEKIEQMKNE